MHQPAYDLLELISEGSHDASLLPPLNGLSIDYVLPRPKFAISLSGRCFISGWRHSFPKLFDFLQGLALGFRHKKPSEDGLSQRHGRQETECDGLAGLV